MVSTGSGHVCTHSVIVGYLCDQTSPSAGHSLGDFTMSKPNHSTIVLMRVEHGGAMTWGLTLLDDLHGSRKLSWQGYKCIVCMTSHLAMPERPGAAWLLVATPALESSSPIE